MPVRMGAERGGGQVEAAAAGSVGSSGSTWLRKLWGRFSGSLRMHPRYLGSVLADGEQTVGHCFRIYRGVWVTAHSVLSNREDLRLRRLGKTSIPVHAVAPDRHTDTAILRVDETELRPCPVAAIAPSDAVEPGAEVVITVLTSELRPSSHYVDLTGTWSGGTTRDGIIRLGEPFTDELLKRLRGAPVRRRDDNVVVGIVASPGADADIGPHSLYVSRTEDLRAFTDGIIDGPLNTVPPGRHDLPSITIVLNILAAFLVYPVSDYLEAVNGRSIQRSSVVLIGVGAFFSSLLAYVQIRRWIPFFTRHKPFRRFQPYFFTIVPAILALLCVSGGAQVLISMAPRPVTLYLLDQTETVARIEGDLDRILRDEFGAADTDVSAGLKRYGGGPPEASTCQTSSQLISIRPYEDFKRALDETLEQSEPAGHAKLEDAVVAAISDLKKERGQRTLVIITTGGDQCDDPRPSPDLSKERDEQVHIRLVEVRLDPDAADDNRRAFVQFLAPALDADHVVCGDVGCVRNAIAPPTYRNPGIR